MNYAKFAGLSLIIVSAFYGHHMQGMFGWSLQGLGLTQDQRNNLERQARIEKENVLIQQAIINSKKENFQSNKYQAEHCDGSFGMNRILFDQGNLIKKGLGDAHMQQSDIIAKKSNNAS
jgi:hypothetical protein